MRTVFARDGRKAAALADAFHDLGREEPESSFSLFALHMVRQCIVGNYGAASVPSAIARLRKRGFRREIRALHPPWKRGRYAG